LGDDSLLGRLAEEFTERVRAGELPDLEEYAGRHPELAGRIRELFPTLMLLEGMADTGVSAAAQAAPALLSSGSIFGSYRIEREVGRGGMGIVYEAVHALLEKRVALKVLPVRTPADAGHLERFFREARTAAGLHHTNIVPVFDVGQVAGTPYFAMQYVEGRGLDRILRLMQSPAEPDSATLSSCHDARPCPRDDSDGAAASPVRGSAGASARMRAGLPAKREDYFRWVAGIGIQAAEGLAHAHERKVIHRDIKPSNLLLDNQGVLWIADFGLARRVEDPALTQSGALLGTPRYMSPEQAQATKYPVDERSDIYSLGATLYELLTCRPVFEGKTPQEVLSQIITREPVAPRRLNPEIPTDLAVIVMKAMAKRPEDRYQSGRELSDDLDRWRKMEPIKARPIGPVGRTIRWCRRNPRIPAMFKTTAYILFYIVGLLPDLFIYRKIRYRRKHQKIRSAFTRAELIAAISAPAAVVIIALSGTFIINLNKKNQEIAALQAVLRDNTEEYINRTAEVRRIVQKILGYQEIESFPIVVGHLCMIFPWNENLSPEMNQVLTESEEHAFEMARRVVNLHDARFAESIQILGEYFDDKKRLDRAEWLYRQTLDLAKPIAQHRRLITRTKEKLVALLEKSAKSAADSGNAGKAAACYREVLRIRREISP
jgi:serine/threonine protein kinase